MNFISEAAEAKSGSRNWETGYSRRRITFPPLYHMGDAPQSRAQRRASEIIQELKITKDCKDSEFRLLKQTDRLFN